MIDGTVARITGKASDFGSKFDSIADLILVFVLPLTLGFIELSYPAAVACTVATNTAVQE